MRTQIRSLGSSQSYDLRLKIFVSFFVDFAFTLGEYGQKSVSLGTGTFAFQFRITSEITDAGAELSSPLSELWNFWASKIADAGAELGEAAIPIGTLFLLMDCRVRGLSDCGR